MRVVWWTIDRFATPNGQLEMEVLSTEVEAY